MSASLKPVQSHAETEARRSRYLLSPSYIDEMKVGEEEEEEEEMSSDCSSGCQSGWTMYLEQSSSEFCKTVVDEKGGSYEHEEEEEGLSMVSDASSGPPQLRLEDEHRSRCYRKSNICSWDTGCHHGSAFAPPAAMAKYGVKKRRIGDPSSALVDTATSPLFSFPKTSFNKEDNFMKPFTEHVLDFPCSFSYAHVEEKSALQNPMDCLQSFTLFKPTPVRPMSSKGGNKLW
ncbi:hypothetical protein MUK42_15838 [Musa troglodytarum]|uniref:Uncharacterized protein n=1 Tax=Musa troglodytarum TaxID=320322 RepID=A0A9E7HEQ1_9LILI|nr:hypothetical protein MUK42_15838 [Musa troglodytarum]